MRFAEFVCLEAVQVELLAVDKQGVIHELVQALLNAGQLAEDDFKPIVDAILKREELGSTGIGRRTAIPHTKHDGVDQTVAAIGISRRGVDFSSIDGDSVYVFFLLISPAERPDDHLKALEWTARQLRKDTFSSFLQQANSVDEIKQLLDEADEHPA